MHAVFAACAVISQAPSVNLDIDSVAWQVRSAAWRITSKCSCQAWCNCNTFLAGLSILVPPQTSAAGRSVSSMYCTRRTWVLFNLLPASSWRWDWEADRARLLVLGASSGMASYVSAAWLTWD